jgi:sugar (pentulose or hexulose) kinase
VNGIYLMGIDAGTSMVKCTIFDTDGAERFGASRSLPVLRPGPELAEQDMNSVYQAVIGVMADVCAKAGTAAGKVAAIAVTGQSDGSWLVDTRGEPYGRAIVWQDGRSAPILNRLREDGTTTRAFKLTAQGPHAGSTTMVLRWLLAADPDLGKRGLTNLWCKDWVGFKLTGELNTDPSEPVGLVDLRSGQWLDEALDVFGLRMAAPVLSARIIRSTDLAGRLLSEPASLTGLKAGTPVYKAQVDTTASCIGAGAVQPGDAVMIVSTSGDVSVVMGDVSGAWEPAGIGVTVAHTATTWLRNLGISCATPSLDWFLREFGDSYRAQAAQRKDQSLYDVLDETISRVPAGSEGIIFHAYLAPCGERAPFARTSARGSFNGLTETHGRDHMLRALYEGVAFGMRDSLEAIPVKTATVRLGGGGARSPVWAQMFADVLGRTVLVPEGTEFGARGAVMSAGVGAGIYASFQDAAERAVRVGRVYQPNENHRRLYDRMFGIYRELRVSASQSWDGLQATLREATPA